jgi:Cys-rich repeat protein
MIAVWLVVAGCSSSGAPFHAEAELLPDFKKDTGLQPPGQPVQVQLAVAANAKLTVDAAFDAGGPAGAPVVVGRRGSGALALEGAFKLTGRLKVDVPGLAKYDDAIPNLDQDIELSGRATFDPFLLGGGKATVSAAISPTDLPPIPLPGGFTGQIVVSIADGSAVTADFTGVCAGVAAGKAQYLGQATIGGTIKLKAKVVIKLPGGFGVGGGDKTIDLPDLSIPIPPTAHAIDLGTVAVSGGGATPMGDAASTASQASCSDGPSGAGSDGGASDGDGGASDGSDGGATGGDGGSALPCTLDDDCPAGQRCTAGYCRSNAGTYVPHAGIAWSGAILQTVVAADVKSCQALCDGDPSCIAFGFSTVPISSYNCQTASSADGASQYADSVTTFIAASEPDATYRAEIGIDHMGNDLPGAPSYNMTVRSCAALCNATTGCVGFTLSLDPTDNGSCWLKSAFSAPLGNTQRMSYCRPGTANCSGL